LLPNPQAAHESAPPRLSRQAGGVEAYRYRIDSTALVRSIVSGLMATRQKLPKKRFVNPSLTTR
jgi:hypothetical protein